MEGGDRYAGTLRYASVKVGHRRGLSEETCVEAYRSVPAYRRAIGILSII